MTGPEPRTFRATTPDRKRDAGAPGRFTDHRQATLAELDDIERVQEAALAVQDQVLSDLPAILERFADSVMDRGAHVCWATTARDARDHIASVARRHDARRVVTDGSSVTDEIAVDVALDAQDAEVTRAGLGQWIMKLADESAGHLIAPALHQTRHQVRGLLTSRASRDPAEGSRPLELAGLARQQLADAFLSADVGITGVDLAVAGTGSLVMVTAGANDRLVTSLPRVHVAVVSLERVVESWEQADVLLSPLTRSATAPDLPSYLTVLTGPRRAYELDGPDELHVVILDNGRSRDLGSRLTGSLTDVAAAAGRDLPAPPSERTAWRMWGDAWSEARTYAATTHAMSWDLWAGVLSGHLPPAGAPTSPSTTPPGSGSDIPHPARQSFRDRWRKGLV